MDFVEEEEMRYYKETPHIDKPEDEKTEEEKRLGVNPFLENLLIPYKLIVDKSVIKSTRNGEEEYAVKYEARIYTKVYSSPELRKVKCNLSDDALRLLSWIIDDIQLGKDYISINKKRYIEENNLKSYIKYTKGYQELITKGIITRSVKDDVFWINPKYFYKGNALEKFKDHTKQVK